VTKIADLHSIEVEHLLGEKHGPLVKIRCSGPKLIMLGEVGPASARQIAEHLMEAAARAEYEADLHSTMTADGWTPEMMGAVLHMVRRGEANRHTNQGDTP
jgi:hypothetical protein